MPTSYKSSKHSRAFAEEHGLPSADPNTFTPEQQALFEQYKKEKDQERQRQHYEKRKETGKAPKRKPVDQMTEEEREMQRQRTSNNVAKAYALKQALREAAIRYGLPAPARMNDTTLAALRTLLRTKLSEQEVRAIETSAAARYNQTPHERKAPDANGQRKPGPPKTMRENPDPAASRSAGILNQFFDKYPDIPRVAKVAELKEDQHKLYRSFVRQLNPEPYRAREQAYDAAHREERAEAQKKRREEDPEAARSIEQRYRDTENGSLVCYFRAIRFAAAKNNWPFDITKETVEEFIPKPCYYCGELFDGPGVDAVDIEAGYVPENIQSCCAFCNRGKAGHHWRDFVRIMCNVGAAKSESTTWTFDYTFVNPDKQLGSACFRDYVNGARARGIHFELSQEYFQHLVTQPCSYCGYKPARGTVGVDRVDSDGHYTEKNVTACCGTCNRIKSDAAVTTFYSKAVNIFGNWATRL